MDENITGTRSVHRAQIGSDNILLMKMFAFYLKISKALDKTNNKYGIENVKNPVMFQEFQANVGWKDSM